MTAPLSLRPGKDGSPMKNWVPLSEAGERKPGSLKPRGPRYRALSLLVRQPCKAVGCLAKTMLYLWIFAPECAPCDLPVDSFPHILEALPLWGSSLVLCHAELGTRNYGNSSKGAARTSVSFSRWPCILPGFVPVPSQPLVICWPEVVPAQYIPTFCMSLDIIPVVGPGVKGEED